MIATGRNFRSIPERMTTITECFGRSVVRPSVIDFFVTRLAVSRIILDFTSPDDIHGIFPFFQKLELLMEGVIPPFHDPRVPRLLTSQPLGITPASVFLNPSGISPSAMVTPKFTRLLYSRKGCAGPRAPARGSRRDRSASGAWCSPARRGWGAQGWGDPSSPGAPKKIHFSSLILFVS